MGRKNKTTAESISNVPTKDLSFSQLTTQIQQKPIWESVQTSAVKILVINDNDVGLSYKQIFGPFLNSSVIKIVLEDPFLIIKHQISNLKILLSLIKNECPMLHEIEVKTNKYNESEFNELKQMYPKQNLSWKKDKNLHDRQICFSKSETMTIIEMGRGLDIYQTEEYKRLGENLNQDEMKCKKTRLTAYECPLPNSETYANNTPETKGSWSTIVTKKKKIADAA